MGVPKFFRYISERYPCLSEKIKEYQIPEFDNLYLDMNGIIHTCSHPNDADVGFRISEEMIFKNIFQYIETLFRIIQPQKLFFLAVDGVAPRAKINQQRSRRFRSAKDAEDQLAKAKANNQEIPKEARFDSNCITPGTLFMSKLNQQLKYFITYKISTDELWQKCKVIFSGSEVPGEGEHKIMDYIRYMKAQPEYEGNTRHCLYGLDADLIMLGLCSHEPHFSLLREEVKFGGKARKKILTAEETNFSLLHLSLMREYLEHEFSSLKSKLSFDFDIEKVIDDWVLMGFLVGNDFIPHLPNLHIESGALPILYNIYMETLPTLDGYINEAGSLNLERFQKFMEKLSSYDVKQFDEIYTDLKFFEAKTGRRLNESKQNNKSSANTSPKKTNKALDALIMATETELGESENDPDDDSDDDYDDDIYIEFVQHKRDYYMNKMEYENVDADIMRDQAEGYIRAIQWILNYYYNGCCSWSWYYPHHYAPYISDIKNFKDLKLEFDMGKPFLPFQQLLAALPVASKNLLPEAYHGLMTDRNSPIINYYPLDFETDLNGKKQEWEAIVLIPLIDEKSLLEAMEPCNANLSVEEKKRNQHGPMCIFTYTNEEQGTYQAPEYFPDIQSYAHVKLVDREDILVPREKLVKGLCKGVKLNVYYRGFPTLQHIPHTSSLAKAKVKVFEQASRGENMILSVLPKIAPSIDDLAQKWLGKSVYIYWPHMIEALVVGLCNSKKKLTIPYPEIKNAEAGNVNFNNEKFTDMVLSSYNVHRKTITENFKNRLGIDVGDIEIVVHVCPLVGRQYVYTSQGKLTLNKQWNENPVVTAYQTIVENIHVNDEDYARVKSITDVFKPKSVCFMLGHPHYGAMGEVTDEGVDLKTSRIRLAFRVVMEPNLDNIKQLQAGSNLRYMPSNVAAQKLSISSHLLSRITGAILVVNGNSEKSTNASKQNVGLNLKFNKKNEEVPGFTKKDNNGIWLYSMKAVNLVRSYMQKFPGLFERLRTGLLTNEMFVEADLFPENGSEKMSEAVSWIKEQQESLGTTSRVCGCEDLELEVVQAILSEVVSKSEDNRQTAKTVLMQVKPHLLYKPGLNSRTLPPDSKAQHRLFDRIVCSRISFTVPVGYKGTIIGIQKNENANLNMYEVLFDKAFAGGLDYKNIATNQYYRLSAMDFINLTYGFLIENKNSSTINVASNWQQQQQQRKQQQQQQTDSQSTKYSDNYCSWRKAQQQPPPPLMQQLPDLTSANNFYPSFSKNGQNNLKKGSQNQPQAPGKTQTGTKMGLNSSNVRTKKTNTDQQQQAQFPIDPTVLQRQTESSKKIEPLMKQSNPVQNVRKEPHTLSEGPSEFQALWNELQKIKKPKGSPKRQPPQAPKEKSNQLSATSKESPQDPSAFLKAMLKISDENAQCNKPSSAPAVAAATTPPANKPLGLPQTAKTTDTPPMVQQLFDHARQAELKSGKSIWYCSQLLSHFQILGSGFPRYTYCENKDNLVCAQITLPDLRTYCGDFCYTYSQAAENTAKKVYEELKLDKAPAGNQISLRLPPQQWFNNRMPDPIPSVAPVPIIKPMLPPPIPMVPNVKPILPPALPPVPLMQIPMPKWRPMIQQSSPFVGPPMHHGPPPQQFPFHNRFPQPPIVHNADNRPNRQEAPKKPTPFVPLQAQKKTRNAIVKQNSEESRSQNKSHEKTKVIVENKMAQEPKPIPPEIKQEHAIINSKPLETVPQSNQAQNAQKAPRVVKPRRSRVAAKFQSDPMANGGDRQ